MARLALQGVVTPVGAITPEYLTQHYADTVGEKVYIAFGLTNADWLEIGSGSGGGGGGGGSSSTVSSTQQIVTDASPGVIDLNSTTIHYALNLEATGSGGNIITFTNTPLPLIDSNVEAKMVSLTVYTHFGVSGDIHLVADAQLQANNIDITYLDDHDFTRINGSDILLPNKSGKILILDVIYTGQSRDAGQSGNTNQGSIIVIKKAQTNEIVL
jgi:hypothetical protein